MTSAYKKLRGFVAYYVIRRLLVLVDLVSAAIDPRVRSGLGLGLRPSTAAWGLMVAEERISSRGATR
jgi:hypothetical protein